MKFTDGHWLIREGYSLHHPIEARSIAADRNSITVFAPDRHITGRGDTLNGLVLEIKFSSPMLNVIRVQAVHYRGRLKRGPEFKLNIGDPHVEIIDDDKLVSLKSGGIMAEIKKDEGWNVDFTFNAKPLTSSRYKNMAWIEGPELITYMREQLELGVGECVYGLGERFTNFVKNGQTVDVWNRDGGTGSEQAYKNIPFYITNKGYGVLVNHPGLVSFEIASERVSKSQFSVEGESLDYFVIGGETLKEVLMNYTLLTGKPALPPAWSFGLWLTTSFTTSYDEATVNKFIDGMAERDIPLQVFHFDCFWMKEYQWCDFEWDKDVFPDPAGMLRRLKAKGLKICAWINPYIAQRSKLFDEGMEKGFLLHDMKGNVWQWDLWQAGMGIVDFTNPAACRWYQEKLKALLDIGVDCFKTDFGERIPMDVKYFDGSDPERMHNYYTLLYNKTVFDLLVQERGTGDAVVFARSATVGGQKFPVHWGGDNSAVYASMAETLRGGLSLCLSGFGFWSHDIGGFEATATPDLYKRWAAFGLLSSHSRLHGSMSYRVPWLFDEEAVDVLRFFTRLKCSLMPYLYAAACVTANTGLPLMRAMVLEFCGDPACDTLERQYMLGENLLVAPVFSESGDVRYYLPEGIWTNILTGDRITGCRWIKENHGYMSLPLLARPNSIIAVGANGSLAEYDYADNVVIHLYELGDNCTAGTKVYNCKGDFELEVSSKRKGNAITVASNGTGKPWSLMIHGTDRIIKVHGATFDNATAGIAVVPGSPNGVLQIDLAVE